MCYDRVSHDVEVRISSCIASPQPTLMFPTIWTPQVIKGKSPGPSGTSDVGWRQRIILAYLSKLHESFKRALGVELWMLRGFFSPLFNCALFYDAWQYDKIYWIYLNILVKKRFNFCYSIIMAESSSPFSALVVLRLIFEMCLQLLWFMSLWYIFYPCHVFIMTLVNNMVA